MKKAIISFSLLFTTITATIEAQATISYPLPINPYGFLSISTDFKPPLKQRCLAITVSKKMKDWAFGQGYSPRGLHLILDFQEDGSIANLKLTRGWGWENRDAPAIELSSNNFAINYGRVTEDETSWRLRSFSHRHTDNYATINLGLIIYRLINSDGSIGDMTKVHLVVFEKRVGQQEERIFRSVSGNVIDCKYQGFHPKHHKKSLKKGVAS